MNPVCSSHFNPDVLAVRFTLCLVSLFFQCVLNTCLNLWSESKEHKVNFSTVWYLLSYFSVLVKGV